MALTEYSRKRNFKTTPEPRGHRPATKRKKETLMFVVQEHHASHLHYDFRLEWDGTLKSWSVPKGPSLDPHIKRLAVEVEDHPVEYGSFEGVIPEKQYGAGRVYIWDTGTWSPIGDAEAGFIKGKLEFEMKGNKLKGRWLLIRTRAVPSRSSSKPQWLLMKRTDEFAEAGDVADLIEDLKEKKPRKKRNTKAQAKKTMGAKGLKLTHPDKILYSSEKLTKRDVAEYYMKVSDLILPYLKDRPLTLVRCPEGTKKICFYQKHMSDSIPEFIDSIEIKEKTKTQTYMSVSDREGLTSLVQMGAFEIHCWNSRKGHIEYPDQIVMDFDPGPGVPWEKVVKATFQLKEILDSLGLKSFVKLSGGKGIHVHIPFRAVYTWEQVKEFSKALALQLQKAEPRFYLTKMTKSLRANKLFVDYLRNTRGATAVAPYSLRSKDVSSVALPLSWQELQNAEGPQAFSLTETLRYLKKRADDPWADYFHELQELPHLKVQE